jgi:uncharacterized damage-inducible protein DinB
MGVSNVFGIIRTETMIMAKSDPMEILLRSNLWATRNIIQSCANLTSEQFHRRFEMGPGSIHDTTTHILMAMRVWTDMLAGREARPRLGSDGRKYSIAELLTLLMELDADLSAEAHRLPLDATITATRGDKTYTFTRGAVLTHLTTHGMHHRAQCLNMLRHLGANPLPQSSVLDWVRAGEPV